MHVYSLRTPRLLATFGIALLAACGGSSGSTEPQSGGQPTVQATPSLQFTPNNLTVAVGSSVTFAFGSIAHNVFFDNTQGAPPNIGDKSNASVTVTFNTAGTYVYNCHLHPGMQGTVVVR